MGPGPSVHSQDKGKMEDNLCSRVAAGKQPLADLVSIRGDLSRGAALGLNQESLTEFYSLGRVEFACYPYKPLWEQWWEGRGSACQW